MVRRFGSELGRSRTRRIVWQVTLQGTRTVCPPAGASGACEIWATTARVYLDHATGEGLFTSFDQVAPGS